jgi:hypothetical protein
MAADDTPDDHDDFDREEVCREDEDDPFVVPPEEMPDEDDERVIPPKDPEEVLEMNSSAEEL